MLFAWVASAAAALVLASLPTALGHGNIVEPGAQWKDDSPQPDFVSEILIESLWGEIDGTKYGEGSPGAIKYFDDNFPKSPYRSLKELILAKHTNLQPDVASAECGFTLKDENKRSPLTSPIKHSSVFQPGPCEVWCGDNKVAYASDCQTTYGSEIPVDKTKCQGADQLTLYWLEVQGTPWQVYINCVWLTGSAGGSPTVAPSPANTSTPATTTRAPVPTTARPLVPTSATPPPQSPSIAPANNDAPLAPRPTTTPAPPPRPVTTPLSNKCRSRM